jgi:hypothetical protein
MEQDLRANINIQNLLEINEQLKSDLQKYKPEFETEFNEQDRILSIHMKYAGKVRTTIIDKDMARYYLANGMNNIEALCSELSDELIFPFSAMIKEHLQPFAKMYVQNLKTLGDM